ncbi:hypothetical protein ACFWYW_22800 [Nonomuraea sp. NPDC059023]|uniref:hypothetical protein n=1 Tax=unclassified Nonomuraea TaxID=2593643 RepID=UPI0036C0FBAB
MIEYDDPASLRGQLQRGRGAAVRRAPAEPGAADAVYECVVTDTRWDRQVDQRDSYLAGLIVRLGLPLAPIEQYLSGYDGADGDPLAPDVHDAANTRLMELAALGVPGAAAESEGPGRAHGQV